MTFKIALRGQIVGQMLLFNFRPQTLELVMLTTKLLHSQTVLSMLRHQLVQIQQVQLHHYQFSLAAILPTHQQLELRLQTQLQHLTPQMVTHLLAQVHRSL